MCINSCLNFAQSSTIYSDDIFSNSVNTWSYHLKFNIGVIYENKKRIPIHHSSVEYENYSKYRSFFFFYHPVHYMTWWHAPSRHKNSYGSLRTQYLRGGGERVCSKSLICWTRGSNRPPSPPQSPQRVTPRTQRPGASGAADITLVIKKNNNNNATTKKWTLYNIMFKSGPRDFYIKIIINVISREFH